MGITKSFFANICQVAKENNLYFLLKVLYAKALHISVNKVMIISLKNTNLLEWQSFENNYLGLTIPKIVRLEETTVEKAKGGHH